MNWFLILAGVLFALMLGPFTGGIGTLFVFGLLLGYTAWSFYDDTEVAVDPAETRLNWITGGLVFIGGIMAVAWAAARTGFLGAVLKLELGLFDFIPKLFKSVADFMDSVVDSLIRFLPAWK